MLHWTSTLYKPNFKKFIGLFASLLSINSSVEIIFVLVFFLLYWSHVFPILLSALFKTFLLYCCYYTFEFMWWKICQYSSSALTISMYIPGFLNEHDLMRKQKKTHLIFWLKLIPFKMNFYLLFLGYGKIHWAKFLIYVIFYMCALIQKLDIW